MANVTMKFNDLIISMTRREFTLITKALVGALEQGKEEDARQLGEEMLKRRIMCLREEEKKCHRALDHALDLVDECVEGDEG